MFSSWALPTLGDVTKAGQGISSQVAIFDGGYHRSEHHLDLLLMPDLVGRVGMCVWDMLPSSQAETYKCSSGRSQLCV